MFENPNPMCATQLSMSAQLVCTRAGLFEEPYQGLKVMIAHMGKLPLVHLTDRLIELLEQFQPRRLDPALHHTPIG